MIITVNTEFDDREKSALEIIADIDCKKFGCRICPFYKRINDDITICIKNYVREILKEANHDQSKH